MTNANAIACSIPWRSAPSDIVAIAGDHRIPIAGAASTISTASCQAASGHGSSTITTAEEARPTTAGARRPRRSEIRPATGATTASSAEAARKQPAIAAVPAPSASSRSGPSTLSVPNISPGMIISQMPSCTLRSRTVSISAPSRGGGDGSRAGVRSAQNISPTATTPTLENTASGPSSAASAPSTGPNSEPTIATPIAEPISSPRRSRGASPISHPSAPAQVIAPATPCTKRAVSSTTRLSPNANTTLVTAISARPTSVVGRTPARAASQPPGSAPRNVPAGYAAASTPACDLVMSSCST